MAIADDIAIDGAKAITYTGAAHTLTGAGYYSVIEFHRFLQDIADDAIAGSDDLIDITSDTPSERSTDNIIKLVNSYNITQELSEHLYDGTIIQGTAGVDQKIWDGLVVIANPDMDLQIMQEGVSIATPFWNTIMFNDASQNPNGYKGLNRDEANGISHRFMFLVHDFAVDGGDIDGRRLIGTTRQIGFTYSEFKINGTSNGNNVLALTYANDLNDATDASGRTAITNIKEGFNELDINANGTPEEYYSQWNRDTFTVNEMYERLKYLTAEGTATTIYGLPGEDFRGITHEISVTPGTGTWVEPELLSWTGGTGQLLAVNDTDATVGTTLWMQILTGVAPSAQTVTGAGGATGTSASSSERVVSTPFCGSSTGSALIGAYGLGMEVADTGASDIFTDLGNTTVYPPNNVTFSVGGVVVGEDRVLVGPRAGAPTTLQVDQFALNANVLAAATSVVFKLGTETPGTGTNSETDTPDSGTIRYLDDTGVYQRVRYDSYTVQASTITFDTTTNAATDVTAATLDANGFISYVDKLSTGTTESITVVFAAERKLFVRVRDGGTAGDAAGIKTFETNGTLGSAGGSTTAIRTSDQ